jgi:hypothetical protein
MCSLVSRSNKATNPMAVTDETRCDRTAYETAGSSDENPHFMLLCFCRNDSIVISGVLGPNYATIFDVEAMMRGEMSDRAGEMALFCAVVDANSITGGGEVIGLTPSGASRTLRRLEDRLAVRLLIRTSRRLTLTRDGEDYYRAAKRILRDLDEVEAGLGEHVSPRGRLRVSATVAFGRHAIVPLIPAFHKLYPDVVVDLSLTDTVVDLNKGEADVAIRVGPLQTVIWWLANWEKLGGLLSRRLLI